MVRYKCLDEIIEIEKRLSAQVDVSWFEVGGEASQLKLQIPIHHQRDHGLMYSAYRSERFPNEFSRPRNVQKVSLHAVLLLEGTLSQFYQTLKSQDPQVPFAMSFWRRNSLLCKRLVW